MMKKIITYEEYLQDVKKGIVTDLGNCPVTPLLLMLQGKWKSQILYELCIHDTIRFGELKRELPGITNTMLTSSLRELEADGLINRVQYNEIPPRVVYSFTKRGRDLLPVFYAITVWGFKHENDKPRAKEASDGKNEKK
jgi:Predicted transcriptional regulators